LTARALNRVDDLGLVTPNTSGMPIIELPVAAEADLSAVAAPLWERGVYLTLAPLVAHAQVGVRVQLTAVHTDEQVGVLTDTLTALAGMGAFRRAA
jgi:7-keto-8-aminopelargonate synthetase-like enzyme